MDGRMDGMYECVVCVGMSEDVNVDVDVDVDVDVNVDVGVSTEERRVQ